MSPLRREAAALLLAAQFLTRLPIRAPYSPAALAASTRWHGLVGAGIGAAAGAVFWAATPLVGAPAGALLALAAAAALTGALHEDGLADLADGLGGGRTRARALEIMRDSRIGAFGALALILATGLKAAALAELGPETGALAMVAAHAGSRVSAIAATAGAAYARAEGAASGISGGPGAATLILGGATAAAAAAILPGPGAAGALLGLAASHLATRALYQRRLGGYTGDALGAVQQTGEIGVYLGIAACL